MRSLRSLAMEVTVVLLVSVVAVFTLFETAKSFYAIEAERGGRGYIHDEAWYVSAARNMLVEVFKSEPRQSSAYNATVMFIRFVQVNETWTRLEVTVPDRECLRRLAEELGVSLLDNYTNQMVYVSGTRSAVEEFVRRVRELYGDVVSAVPGWQMPDIYLVQGYLNLEHPPVAKYLIALVLVTLGDHPLHWRVLPIAFGVGTAVLTFLVLHRLSRSFAVGVAGVALLLADPLFRAVSSIAILDGFIAFFAALSLYMLITRRYWGATVVSLVGGLFKAPSIFASIAPIALLARRRALGSLLNFIYNIFVYGLVTVLLYIVLLHVASAPLIAHLGYLDWLRISVGEATIFHLSDKCLTPDCPGSAPWDWFIGRNAFPLYIYPDGRELKAMGIYPLWWYSLVLAVVTAPLIYRGYRELGYVLLEYFGVVAGYVAIWVLGARSQFSFYAVHLAPLVYISLVYTTYILVAKPDARVKAVEYWIGVVGRVKEFIERVLMLR